MNLDDLRFPSSPLLKPEFVVPAFKGLPHYLSGEGMFRALVGEIERLRGLAREDQDVLIFVGDVPIVEVRYVEPHTLAFRKLSDHPEWVEVCHFSQVRVQLLIMDRHAPERPRVITGFSREATT